LNDPLLFARAFHFAATIVVAGAVFFVAYIGEPALREAKNAPNLAAVARTRFAWIAWIGLVVLLLSGVAWFVLTAASMSGRPLGDLASQGVLWIVLTQTDFGNDWLLRFVVACALGGLFVHFLSVEGVTSRGLRAVTVILAAALVGALAWSGHAIGGQGIEGILHPAADVLHLIAAAAWVGMLLPLVVLLGGTGDDAQSLAIARIAVARFSTVGIVAVGTLLATGSVNTWYLAGSIAALSGSEYGRLLLAKIALFLVMVAIAAVNRFRLTPRIVPDGDPAGAQRALRRLRGNAVIEVTGGAMVICIVAALGILPPASHAHHHGASDAIPADASFQHIHTEQGMADVTIEPGHTGVARITLRLWDEDENPLAARQVTLTLAPPAAGSKPITRTALQDADGRWQVKRIELSQPGNWTVTVTAMLGPGNLIVLAAPIVIDAK